MIITSLFPYLFILLGALFLIRPSTYTKLIQLSNELRGTKTQITSKTVLMGKVTGVGFILFGLFLLGKFYIYL